MVRFIQPSPFQAAHVTLYHSKGSRYPVNHRTEITFQFSRGRLVTVYAHIGINAHLLTVANPPEGFRQIILPFHISLDIMTPFLYFRILGITEHPLGCIHELARIDSIEQFLLLERNAHNIDGLEPLLYFLFFTLAFIYQQRGLHNLLLLLFGQSREILYVIRFILDGEFSCNEPTDRSDALLPVKYFKSSVHSPVEID